MLYTLRMAPDKGQVKLGTSFQADIAWFVAFLPQYNGIHLIDPPKNHCVITCQIEKLQATIKYQENIYAINIPSHCNKNTHHCNLLWVIFICAKLWSPHWKDTHVMVNTPSSRVATVINTGASRNDSEMQLARNIWLLSAVYTFTINATTKNSERLPKSHIQLSDVEIRKADSLNKTL
jgi:hypothetical protein